MSLSGNKDKSQLSVFVVVGFLHNLFEARLAHGSAQHTHGKHKRIRLLDDFVVAQWLAVDRCLQQNVEKHHLFASLDVVVVVVVVGVRDAIAGRRFLLLDQVVTPLCDNVVGEIVHNPNVLLLGALLFAAKYCIQNVKASPYAGEAFRQQSGYAKEDHTNRMETNQSE